MPSPSQQHVVVTGGAGYIGAVLVPELLQEGRRVTVLDSFFFGRGPLAPVADHPALEVVEGDIRDPRAVRAVLMGWTRVIGGDQRSFHRRGEWVRRVLGFEPARELDRAVHEPKERCTTGVEPDPEDPLDRSVPWLLEHTELRS